MIKVFRKGNFNTSHERRDLRKIYDSLDDNLGDNEDVFLLVNVSLPTVTREWVSSDGVERKKTYKSVSPDLIVIKKDSLSIIEMKAYPGVIDFPLSSDDLYEHEWTSKVNDFPKQVINENRGNPYHQIVNNRNAFIAYLDEYEAKFASEEFKGSYWDVAEGFILFTDSSVQFKHPEDSIYAKVTGGIR